MRNIWCLVVGLIATPAAAQQAVTFAWDAAPIDATHDAATGYRMEVGTSPGATGATNDVGSALTGRITFTQDGTYYVRVRAYNTAGVSEGTTNEVSVAIDLPDPTDPCLADPLVVTVTQWPQGRRQLAYTSNRPVTVTGVTMKKNETSYRFTDQYGCTVTVTK